MILLRVSPAAFLFPCLCMCHAWCLHANTHVWEFCVVEQDDTFKFLLAYLPCGYSHLIEPLSLKDAVGTLSHRILQRVAALRHTDTYIVSFLFLYISLATILAATVGVVYQHSCRLIVYCG